MQLNLDGHGHTQPEQIVAKSAKPSILARLKAKPEQGTQEKPKKKELQEER